MPAIKGHVRRSQVVTTYGVGATVALGDESFMVAGIDQWPQNDHRLHEPRLEQQLQVNGFCVPPASDGDDIPVVRFPRWHSCPKCHRLDDIRRLAGFDSNMCGDCNRQLVPSRFVVACLRSHIDDFPYMRWVHHGRPREGVSHTLFMEALGATASLRDIKITCICGAEETMEGAFDRFALREVTKCFGNRPWLGKDQEDCTQIVRTVQRGASNVWFGKFRSVISIPPWSENAFQLLDRQWDILRILPPVALEAAIRELGLVEGTQFSVADLVAAVDERKRRQDGMSEQPRSEEELRRDEYKALLVGKPEEAGAQFAGAPAEVPDDLNHVLDKVMLVSRLREVRALEGFSRILPPGSQEELASLFSSDPGWRPAIEVKGEGIFLQLSTEALDAWEKNSAVKARAARVDDRYRARAEQWRKAPDRTVSPRFLLVHTLAHALIDQFALDAGYPAASLRERLYVDDDMAGLLIYTATTDSAGSLGGVLAQGEPERLAASFASAVARHGWCSADPICIESDAQGADSLNLAACHACVLLPETSCEEMNTLLDRGVLVGTPDEPGLGFLSALVPMFS